MSETEDGKCRVDGGRTERLDLAIDRTVRQMLDVEPPPGLRGRVIDRISEVPGASAFPNRVASAFPNLVASAFRRKTWILAPIAAAAIIVLAVMLPWRNTAQPEPPALPSIAKVEPKIGSPNVDAPNPESRKTMSIPLPYVQGPVEQPARRRVAEGIVIATVLAAADESFGVDPLAPIAPITVPAVRPADIAQKDIAISPLAPIAELQIAPLSPPDRRN
jgi:hypothetical protein